MRIGDREKELLQEIISAQKNAMLSFVLSHGSISRLYSNFYKLEQEDAYKRKKHQELKQQRKRMLKRLERKGLVQLIPQGDDVRIKLSDSACAYVGLDKLFENLDRYTPDTWDGKWTLVMFDVPREQASTRQSLVKLLCKIGFIQTQMSNYIFPYEVPQVEEFLQRNPVLGRHCQIFRGVFCGDDSKLRKQFGLPKTK